MADLGTAYLRVIPDTSGLNARLAGYFSSSQWSKLGKSAGVALGAGLAAGGAVKALYEIGQAFDDASDKIRVGTGKTGKQLKGLENDFKAVVKTVPTDFGNAADAITDINRRLGLTGRPLRKLSRQFLELSRMTGTDLGGNIETVSRAFKDWEVETKNQGKTLDGFFRLSQKTGIAVDDIASSVQRFGSPLRQLGFTLGESAAMFANFERAGVNTQTMVPGLKLAIANLTQPTADLAGTMAKLGIAAGKPEKGLRQVLSILGDESRGKVERIGLAMDVFGKRAGSDMKEAIEQGRFSVDKLLKVFRDDNGDSISKASKATQDFTEHWIKFRNKVMVWLEPLSKRVFQAVGREAKELFKIISDPKLSFNEKLEKVFGRAMEKIGELAPKLAGAFFRAWWEAGVWAKIATLAFIAWKIGAIKALGAKVAAWFAAQFMATVGTRVLAALALNGAIGGKVASRGKWTGLGTSAGKWFGRAWVAGALLALPLLLKEYEEEIDNAIQDAKSFLPNPGGSRPLYETIGIPRERKGGVVGFQRGGVLSAVSSGELLAFPDGSSVQVPGRRTRADNVLTRLPVGTAVFTDHGQRMLASGASPSEALARQMPHFATGGTVAKAAYTAGFRGPGLIRMVAEAKGESGWNERAVGDSGNSRGLWQIHMPSHPWSRRLNLFDPFQNAKAARRVWRERGGSYAPWHADHTPHIGAAKRAIAQMAGSGTSTHTTRGPASGGKPSEFREALSGAFEAGRSGRGLGGIRDRILGAVRRGAKRPKVKVTVRTPGVPGGARGDAGFARAVAAANQIDAQKYPYSSPGNRATASLAGPMDCSGAVSKVLGPKGLGRVTQSYAPVSGWYKNSFGLPGRGKLITTFAKGAYSGASGHVFMKIGDRYFGTSGSNPGGGAGWFSPAPSYVALHTARHPRGYRAGGTVEDDLIRRIPAKWRTPEIIEEVLAGGVLPGMRRGGIAGFAAGGVMGWRNIGRSYIGSVTGGQGAGEGVLREYARTLDELTLRQIGGHLKKWAKALKDAEGATAARIRGAAALAVAELRHRAGRLARQSDVLGRKHEWAGLETRLQRARQGIDMTSVAGMQLTTDDLAEDRRVMRERRRKLRRALELARKAGDRQAVQELSAEIDELNTAIKEGAISLAEAARAAAVAAAEAARAELEAAMQFGVDLAGAVRTTGGLQLEGLELDQKLAGTFDTQAGREERASFITGTIIPLIESQMAALKPLYFDALGRGDWLGATEIANQWLAFGNEIKGLTLDANELLKGIEENTSEATQAMVDLLKGENLLWRQRFQVSQAQYGVFGGMPPYGGSYAGGGVVPGPVGAPRTIIAHGGEPVGLPGQQVVTVIVEDGAVDPNKIRVIARGEARGELRRSARSAGRGLPGRGGGVLAHG